jgi:hypothetical protein
MENPVISFPCPVCATSLTVPASLAGVTGPCPACRSQIQAVDSAAVLPEISPVIPSTTALQELSPKVVTLADALPASHVPAISELEVSPVFVSAALVPELGLGGAGQRKSRLRHLWFILLFIMAIGTISVGVISFLKDRSERQRAKSPLPKISVRTISSPDRIPRESSATTEQPPPPVVVPPVPAPAEPPVEAIEPTSLERVEIQTPSQVATKVLEKFLTAQTLSERLPFVMTQTPEPILAKSCLAGPLPAAKQIFIEAIETNAAEQVVNFYHHVAFEAGDLGKRSQTILIQQRDTSGPMVMVDPFLDSYGGRLADYANGPSDQPGTFQVTILPLAVCSEESVPNRDEKLTLKLLAQDDTKEIALAFFGKQSEIAKALEDGTYSLSYGKAKACTVMLRWNTEERPGSPYLEAVALKALDWNP